MKTQIKLDFIKRKKKIRQRRNIKKLERKKQLAGKENRRRSNRIQL